MVPKTKFNRRIVRTEPGSGTAETIYVDEYECRWEELLHPLPDETCPPLTGTVIDGQIITGTRKYQ